MNNFTFYSNEYDEKYEKNLNKRYPTFRIALNLFVQLNGKIILETGTQRQRDDYGAGCSTSIFCWFLSKYKNDGHLYSVDLSSQNIATSKFLTEEYKNFVTHVESDSISYIQNFKNKVDLLYLDSYDWFPNEPGLTECQEHQLNEFIASENIIHDKTIILLDDNNLPNGGKTRKTKDYLLNKGYTCLLDYEQSLWIKL